ncbi:peptide-methionine (S)-S-oxide reductase [Paenibacillus sp. MMO-177]|uniref:peptide-methionine (S)-S-oxide reductase n=1 Tax=Paenibacillus sp. MMO-177 TaxID=3081289 RepID=UPI003015BDA6
MNENKAEKTITLGMGCYWSPEALFGAVPGVIGTRVGFAGGTTAEPTYRGMGDHTETVELGSTLPLFPMTSCWRYSGTTIIPITSTVIRTCNINLCCSIGMRTRRRLSGG